MSRKIKNLVLPERPAELNPANPTTRYWGDREPPKDRAEIFSLVVNNAVASADGTPAATGNVATIRLYGPIDSWGGYWGVSAKDVASAIDSLGEDVTEIRLRINSPGGECWEGLAILNMLRAHGAKVVAVVDGVAASAASFIASGCDETVMSPGTQMMVHDAWASAWSCNAQEMRKVADFLDTVSNACAELYAESAGGTAEAWRAVMVEETWYTAAEAVTAGLADKVAVVKDVGETSTAGDEPDDPIVVVVPDGVDDRFDLSIFAHAGRANAPAPAAAAAPKPPNAPAVGSTETEGGSAVAFSDESIATLRSTLGLADDADEAAILAAAAEVVDKATEPPKDGTKDEQIPEGHVVIPAAKLADLEAGAALATKTAKAMHEKERKSFLDSVRAKYLPTSRAGWEAEFDRDPDAVRTHFADAPDLIPTSALGHDNPVDEHKSEGDAVYASLFGTEKKEAV